MKTLIQACCLLLLCSVASVSIDAEETDAHAALKARVAQLEAQLAERDRMIAVLRSELAGMRGRELMIATRDRQLDAREQALEVMAGAVTTAEHGERFASEIQVAYDHRRQRTVVTAGPARIEEETLPGDFFVSAVYSLPGESHVGQPESVSLFLQGKFSGGQFEGVDSVAFELGEDEGLSIDLASFDQLRKGSGIAGKNRSDKGDETVTLLVDVPTLTRLAESTSLSVRAPRGTLTLSREHRGMFRALLTLMEFEPEQGVNPD